MEVTQALQELSLALSLLLVYHCHVRQVKVLNPWMNWKKNILDVLALSDLL